ncbi:hypothetical protein OBBRIDRAFT_787999 [Obba rivulosa]|uniref:N-alpha-acetyltransferase 40 n=1 Tax=Obba rivulosa TaxID=1052685 RepID=A0A8E2DUA2_9APHY|nr:hypothetical protein OBBRIDRAFT_787999 [Obba rivulosa]
MCMLLPKASAIQLAASLVDQEKLKTLWNIDVSILTSTELLLGQQEAVFTLWEKNMHSLYVDSSFGWDPPSKKRELFHPLSRFIVLHQIDDSASVGSLQKDLIAFAMFRFEREDGQNELYCYELQVHEKTRRMGLGRYLMQQLASIGRNWHMEKIVLTCLKANVNARSFYVASGFELDPTSPEYVSADEDGETSQNNVVADYEILSRLL